MIYLFAFLIVVILIVIIAYLAISGLFHQVKISTGHPPFKSIHIAYKFYKGSFSQIKSAFMELESLKLGKGLNYIGIYYDGPEVEDGKRRYIVGVVLNRLNSDLLNTRVQKILAKNDYKQFHVTEISNAVVSEFPCITSLSILFAVKSVYPKLKEFIQRQKLCAYPFIEFYEKNKVHFVVPLCEQDKFYVPEYYESKNVDEYYRIEDKNVKKSK